jgi:hypothetical protein
MEPAMNIATKDFFAALAGELNAHPEQFKVHGEADMVAALVMRNAGGDFAVRVTFEGLRVEDVKKVSAADATEADYYLDGPLEAWQAMFDDIFANGAASGRLTINSLALLGTDIRLRGDDPMGVDKFSRFNQTLQEYLDGAARVAVAAG